METQYTDSQGIKHDLLIIADHYKKQPYYRILRNGVYFADITAGDSGEFEELFEGPSERAREYGEFVWRLFGNDEK